MKLTIRYFQDEKDMDLQYDFWKLITKELPYAWKPTLSPKLFLEQEEFDPKSRCFAYDGNRLVGHMGFSGKGNFVSLGYPWVLKGYEGQLQEDMFQLIYNYASSSEYGGEMFAQRFRSQWKDQINFFLEKGFEITGRSPIYGRSVPENGLQCSIGDFDVEVENNFDIEQFLFVAKSDPEVTEDHIAFYEEYYQAVDFDFAVRCCIKGKPTAYFGVTVRPDTGYSEIVACTFTKEQPGSFQTGVCSILNELSKYGARTVSIYESLAPDIGRLKELNFEPITEDVMVMKRR